MISLLQCSGGRTTDVYANYDTTDVLRPAVNSAADVTANVLREKGWGGLGIEITSAPQIGLTKDDSGENATQTMLPIVGYTYPAAPVRSVTLPLGHAVNAGSRTVTIADFSTMAPFRPFNTPSFLKKDFVLADGVYYPDAWTHTGRGRGAVFNIPEYCDIAGQQITLRFPAGFTDDFPGKEMTSQRKRGKSKAIIEV